MWKSHRLLDRLVSHIVGADGYHVSHGRRSDRRKAALRVALRVILETAVGMGKRDPCERLAVRPFTNLKYDWQSTDGVNTILEAAK